MSLSLLFLAREGEKDKEGNLYVGADMEEIGRDGNRRKRVSQLVE